MPQANQNLSLEDRRKKLIFRSWHRGTREIDLMLGRFADAYVPGFSLDELDQYEEFLLNSDPDIYNWMTRKEAVPPEHDSAVVQQIIGFNNLHN